MDWKHTEYGKPNAIHKSPISSILHLFWVGRALKPSGITWVWGKIRYQIRSIPQRHAENSSFPAWEVFHYFIMVVILAPWWHQWWWRWLRWRKWWTGPLQKQNPSKTWGDGWRKHWLCWNGKLSSLEWFLRSNRASQAGRLAISVLRMMEDLFLSFSLFLWDISSSSSSSSSPSPTIKNDACIIRLV